jgi:hypothetical protein
MLGWEIMIERGTNKAPFETPLKGQLVANWLTSLGGMRWLDRLVESGHAVDLGGNGYPCRYVLGVGTLLRVLRSGTPQAEGPPVIGDDYYLPGNWTGRNRLELEVLQAADPLELLLVEVWDQS